MYISMYKGSGCEGEGGTKFLIEASIEGSLLSVSKSGPASSQSDPRQQQVRLRENIIIKFYYDQHIWKCVYSQ